ncbi:hypothetical protein D3C79_715960 [compost metagenome]
MQAVDVGNVDVVSTTERHRVVFGGQVAGVVGVRVNGDLDRALAGGVVIVGFFCRSRGDGNVELAMVVSRRLDAQAVEIPAGDIDFAFANRHGVTGAIAEDRAFRNTAQFDAEFFRTIGVGQIGRDAHQLDGAILCTLIKLVALVVTFAVVAVQVADSNASVVQVAHAWVHRDVAVAQVDRCAAIDRQVDVIAARTALVSVVDVQGVITAAGWRERTADSATGAPGGRSHILAADGNQQAVVTCTTEAVGLAGFQVDQAGGLRARATRHTAVGLGVGDH